MGLSPQGLQSLCSSAVVLVELIADRIFLIEVLMVLFRRIEGRCRDDFGHDGFFKWLGDVEPSL